MGRREPPERRLARVLTARGLRLALAESCTGGLLGGRITAVPGSSRYFLGGLVAYHNRIKARLLGVPAAMLARHGAVSAPVVAAMARGARRAFGSDLGLAVTGIAGPGGGSPDKPVGLVYVALSLPGASRVRRARLSGGRRRVRERAAELALNLLLESLEDAR